MTSVRHIWPHNPSDDHFCGSGPRRPSIQTRYHSVIRSVLTNLRSPPADLADRHRGRAPGDEKQVRRHVVELDAHGDALGQTHPAESRVDESEQLARGGAVLVLDAERDALDMTRQHPRIADQLDLRLLADADAPQLGFLEIALDTE